MSARLADASGEPGEPGEPGASGGGDRDAALDAAEDTLCAQVLNAWLREDVNGFRRTALPHERADGPWLTVRSGPRTAELAVRHTLFLCDVTVRRAAPRENGLRLVGLDAVLDFLAAGTAPEDAEGFAAFTAECRAALATARLHDTHRDGVFARLAPNAARGMAGSLVFDTIAAHRDHPAYPTARSRVGFGDREVLSYGPESHPRFAMRWVAVPREAATRRGPLPPWWPPPSRVGLPSRYDDSHVTLPAHPSTAPEALARAYDGLRYGPEPYLTVRPTLSTRTVAVAARPDDHLKVPLATSTLGLRNKRTITPGSLVDGDAGGRLLRLVLDAEPAFRDRVLIADEHTWGHAGHELLAYLVRRHPAGLGSAHVVTVAALTAPGPGGRPVVDALADTYYGGDPLALHDAYLRLLLDWHVTLWLRYGIALEAHQQNTSLVLDHDTSGRTRLRLLLRDHDGPRVVVARARARLGAAADAVAFADPRIPVTESTALADVFTTITMHLCAAAPLFALTDRKLITAADATRLLRTRLEEAAAPHADRPDAAVLRTRLLDAARLPVKLMVTAGTLLDKTRSGAADINKHYAHTGPNYLAATPFPGDPRAE
ncbi:IucA/IucC family siderophore biosynthesis protein [Yinghuangia sp. ASG 101]|uniref:IucA/IucC family siderophore biosynthesis protein n=1 Tax=Yinghuangia sp. ASG 101 TaxID=2896848 RepID=UPI001E4E713E|nr:IucA/IucC family siderophore biosynthesis protein [Yinghuangia sp. ASG 101]UGQ10893.1 IucA/IucC family siderophore biosynthesis protein [Yinghuangia sp. ASG 101]